MPNENTNTMHNPFIALNREGKLPARLRIDFLHQDPPNANPPLPTLGPRLRNSFPFFGDEWLKTGGIIRDLQVVRDNVESRGIAHCDWYHNQPRRRRNIRQRYRHRDPNRLGQRNSASITARPKTHRLRARARGGVQPGQPDARDGQRVRQC